jgi:heme/copper-type cytochrome/quinol oxidase subunit 1
MLGLAGMPRRIPDYPDTYAYLNYISSVGSLLSTIGILVFILVIYYTFCSKFLTIQVSKFEVVNGKSVQKCVEIHYGFVLGLNFRNNHLI